MKILHSCGHICPRCSGSGEGFHDWSTCQNCKGSGWTGGPGEIEIHVSSTDWALKDNPIYCETCGADLKEAE